MSEYEVGDKVVARVHAIEKPSGCYCLDDEDANWLDSADILGKLEDFQPKQEKIKFTPEMKREFDDLKDRNCVTPYIFMRSVENDCHPKLFEWLYRQKPNQRAINQFEFCRAVLDESLIEVVEPEKHQIKVGSQKMYINGNGEFMFAITGKNTFTLDEAAEAEEQLGIQGLQAKWFVAAKESKED